VSRAFQPDVGIVILTCSPDWAGGLTDYSQGPFNMYMKSMTVTDYSTGNSYSYGDKSGSWESIVSNGGKINGNRAEEPTETQAAPSITATASDIPIPWSGTHKETSTFVTPNVWPWVATDRPSTSTGLPSGWESASDRISPPGGSSMSEQPLAPRVNTSLELVTKTESSPQSTSQFTSVSWASSSAVSSPSGLETSGSATRLASSTSSKKIRTKTTKTSTKKTATKTTATKTTATKTTATKTTATKTTATKTDKAAYSSTPTVVSGGISLRVPTILDGFCALVGGILAFI